MAWMGMSMELVKSIWILAQTVKRTLAVQETQVQSLDQEDPLKKGKATHSSILAWRIPWTEKLCELHRVMKNWTPLK